MRKTRPQNFKRSIIKVRNIGREICIKEPGKKETVKENGLKTKYILKYIVVQWVEEQVLLFLFAFSFLYFFFLNWF